MTCKEIEDLLPGMVDGVLPVTEKKRIEAHLEMCASCRKAFADLRTSGERVRSLEEVEPPPWLKARVMARIREEAGQKEGFLRKFFYPLHIKIPIQALATVLIAVVAWNVYKTGEPEFRQMAPPIAVREAPEVRVPTEALKATEPAPVDSTVKKEAGERAEVRGKKTHAPVPSGIEDRAMQKEPTAREEAKSDSAKPAESMNAAKPAAAHPKDEEERRGAGAMRQPEMDQAAQAPARDQKQKAMKAPMGAAAKEAGKHETRPAASPMMSAAVSPRPEMEITLRARNPGAVADKAETILKQVSAQAIDRQTREGRVILTARVETERLEAFREKLKSLGPVQESVHVAPHPGGSLTIRIEIRPE
jgi:hypothetical protein